MASIAFAVPVVPGQEEFDRQMLDEMAGSRREEYEAAMKEAGATRHAVWHQQTPDGSTLAVVYIEAGDAKAAAEHLGSADAPFNQWFREQMQRVHGIDISGPAPPSNQVHDFQV
jgi:hypothetical protein